MKQPSVTPRKCIFCGSRKDISREHVVPNWLRHVIPRVAEEHTHFGVTLLPSVLGEQRAIAFAPQLKLEKRNAGTRKLFMVCEACNSGWMHDLQDQIIPILKPLIRGDWSTFDEGKAERISAWLAMTASVIAMSFPKTRGVTPGERAFIYKNRRPPDGWQMWVGRASGFEEMDYCNRTAEIVSKSELQVEKGEPNLAVTTIALGQIILHCISVPKPSMAPDPINYGIDLGIFPILPWEVALDWRMIPIIHNGSTEWDRLRNAFFGEIMKLFRTD